MFKQLQFVLIICFSFSLKAQIPTALQTKLDQSTTQYFNGHSTRGLSASVYYNSGNAYTYMCRGISHSTVSVTPEMFFSIGSTSKIIASCSILKLQELGQLDLDDTLGKYLPNLSTTISNKITIRQLLRHQSGLDDYIDQAALDSMNTNYNRVWTPQQLLQFIGTPLSNPGQTWNYCNSNYLIAGMLIEHITGQTYLQATRNLVLNPAGLDSLTLMGFEPVKDSVAHMWDHSILTPTTGDITYLPRTSPGCFSWAAGGWMGRAKDLVKMYKAIFVDQTVLNTASLSELQTTVNTGYTSPNNKYGLGVFIYNSSSLNAAQHGGSWFHLCAVATDLDNGNVASVAINDTEGLTTSVNYLGLTIQLLKDMRAYNSVGITENEIELCNQVLYLNNNKFRFNSDVEDLHVYDILGKEVLHAQYILEFDLSKQTAGIYIINADNKIQKVIVK